MGGITKNQDNRRRRRFRLLPVACLFAVLFPITLGIWVMVLGVSIQKHLASVESAIPELKKQFANGSSLDADAVNRLVSDAQNAKEESSHPVWRAAAATPWVGQNFSAVSEVSAAVSDIAEKTILPLASESDLLANHSLKLTEGRLDLEKIEAASPQLSAAATALNLSYAKISSIDTSGLLPQLANPLNQVRSELEPAVGSLETAANAAQVLPKMLGSADTRSYLLMIQNNAESRASGGIPGAVAVLSFAQGKLSLDAQSSPAELGIISPGLPVDIEQQQIYTSRLGKYMQDVNLTPDFPTAANIASAMWENKTGQRVDGVISIDPVVLSYVLRSTGPVSVNGPELTPVQASGLPTELTSENVVATLLSDVYAKIRQPKLQDAYFAGVAKEVFSALSSGKGEAKGLIDGLSRGTAEGRVLLWSAHPSEQSIVWKYPLSGSISGPSVNPAQFGVYFNDGTGAKMDFYVKRTVKLVKECPQNGYEQTTVRITSTNTAPADAATSLPTYVTGGGAFGVAAGSVQTNIVAYGPAQANVESASSDGQKTPFAPYLHANRPVGVIAQQLAPGETKTVDFTFGKIVQHTEPTLVVTPTVQPVKDVVLPTEIASCDQSR